MQSSEEDVEMKDVAAEESSEEESSQEDEVIFVVQHLVYHYQDLKDDVASMRIELMTLALLAPRSNQLS